MDHLRRRALVHLSSAFPTKLSVWDSHTDGSPGDSQWGQPSWSHLTWELDDLIATIQLARQIEAPWILPAVFYDSGDPAEVLFGEKDSSSSIRLDPADQEFFLKGYLLQRDAGLHILRFLFSRPTIDGCTTPAECGKAKLWSLQLAHDDCQEYPAIPLGIWQEGDWDRLSDACATCRKELRVMHGQELKHFWQRLPGMYGLTSWEELETLKVAAIGAV